MSSVLSGRDGMHPKRRPRTNLASMLILLTLAAVITSACNLQAGGLTTTSTPLPDPTALPSAAPTLVGPSETPAPIPTETPSPTPVPSPAPTRGPEAYYKRLIVVDQDSQTMVVYQNGAKIRQMPVSTGKPDDPTTITPAWEGDVGRYVGTFFSFGTWQDEGWYLFEHYGAMLIHGNPYLTNDGKKEYQQLDALGTRPASHGCIRLPPEEAKWFTSWQPKGAHMIIKALTRQF